MDYINLLAQIIIYEKIIGFGIFAFLFIMFIIIKILDR